MIWQLVEEVVQQPRTGVSVKTLGFALYFMGSIFLESGQRNRTEALYKEVKELAEHTGQPNTILVSMWADCTLANMDGRLEEAAAIVHRILVRGDELGIPDYARLTARQAGSYVFLLLGDTAQLKERLETNQEPFIQAQTLAYLHRTAEASAILDQRVVARPGFGTDADGTRYPYDLAFLEAATLSGHKQAAEMLLDKYAHTKIRIAYYLEPTCVPQLLGAAAALLGKHEEARNYYQQAIQICTEMRIRPGLALSRLGLAELLLEHYPAEKKEALEHLDFAIKEFREMKMQPSLERALRQKTILKA
jgi:tetratricopeptide (TPR) repeat protein